MNSIRYSVHKAPKTTEEPANPMHDEYSHGADAFRYLAMIVDRIRNEGDRPPRRRVAPYSNPDPGMGSLLIPAQAAHDYEMMSPAITE